MDKHPLSYRILHWLMAVLFIGALVSQFVFDEMELSPEKMMWINAHKWFGFSVLLLFIPRLLVKRVFVSDAVTKANWEKWIMQATHMLLYVSMVMVPLTGWLMSSAKGYPLVYLGMIPIPDLVSPDKELGHILKEMHEFFANMFMAVLLLHIAGVIKHYVVYKHKILRKML